MSSEHVASAWTAKVGPIAKLLLLAIADASGWDGTLKTSREAICERIGVTKRELVEAETAVTAARAAKVAGSDAAITYTLLGPLTALQAPKSVTAGRPVFGKPVNTDNVPPPIEVVMAYAKERKVPEARAQDFIDHYNLAQWKYGKNRVPITDWRSAFRLFTSKDAQAATTPSSMFQKAQNGQEPAWKEDNRRRAAGLRAKIAEKERRAKYIRAERGDCLEARELDTQIENMKAQCLRLGEPC